jgi:hypothetical protein
MNALRVAFARTLRAWADEILAEQARTPATAGPASPPSIDPVPARQAQPLRPDDEPDDEGPPAHWLEMVRRRAPHLLPPGRRSAGSTARRAEDLAPAPTTASPEPWSIAAAQLDADGGEDATDSVDTSAGAKDANSTTDASPGHGPAAGGAAGAATAASGSAGHVRTGPAQLGHPDARPMDRRLDRTRPGDAMRTGSVHDDLARAGSAQGPAAHPDDARSTHGGGGFAHVRTGSTASPDASADAMDADAVEGTMRAGATTVAAPAVAARDRSVAADVEHHAPPIAAHPAGPDVRHADIARSRPTRAQTVAPAEPPVPPVSLDARVGVGAHDAGPRSTPHAQAPYCQPPPPAPLRASAERAGQPAAITELGVMAPPWPPQRAAVWPQRPDDRAREPRTATPLPHLWPQLPDEEPRVPGAADARWPTLAADGTLPDDPGLDEPVRGDDHARIARLRREQQGARWNARRF